MHIKRQSARGMGKNRIAILCALLCTLPACQGAVKVSGVGGDETKSQLAELERDNFLIGIAAQAWHNEGNRSACGLQLRELLQASLREELWTLKVLDSFGLPARTFAWGNHFWFAAQNLCEDLNVPQRVSLARRQPSAEAYHEARSPMELRFALVYLNYTAPQHYDLQLPFENVLHIGLCLPSACPLDVLQRHTHAYFQRAVHPAQRRFHMRAHAFAARAPHFDWWLLLRPASILVAVISSLLVLLMTLAELHSRRGLRQQTTRDLPAAADAGSTTPAAAGDSTWTACLLCFRLADNWRRTCEPEPRDGADGSKRGQADYFGCIAGLRTVVCLWVSVFHVYYYALYALTGAPLVFAKLETFALQPVMQACFYVDVFFVISALLLVHQFGGDNGRLTATIRANGASANLRLYGRLLLRRYLRLTPVFAVTMLLADVMYDGLNAYTPFFVGEHSGIYCKSNWWLNLLYVQNLVDMRDICCSWTWYLACEMQFYALLTALLMVRARWPRPGRWACGAVAVAVPAASWYCNWRAGVSFQIDAVHATIDALYVKPWVRATPYVGGALIGWLLLRTRAVAAAQAPPPTPLAPGGRAEERPGSPAAAVAAKWAMLAPPPLSRLLAAGTWRSLFWGLCAVLYAATNFMTYWRAAPAWLVALIMSWGKLLFALCVGGVCALCARGHGGWLAVALSARLFRQLGRLCFCIYMAAPLLVVATFGLRAEATVFDEVASGLDFLGVLVLAVAGATLLHVLVELPLQRLADIWWRAHK